MDAPESDTTVAVPEAPPAAERKPRKKPRRQPKYQVVLWNDDDHTFLYVIAMLRSLFGFPPAKGFQIAREVHTQGKAVVLVTTREHAELKRDQIHAYGPDRDVETCAGSMWATIEPVPQDG